MAVKVDPQRRRLSVSTVPAPAPASSAGSSAAADPTDDFGEGDGKPSRKEKARDINGIVDAAREEGLTAFSVSSATDFDLKRRTSFSDKDANMLGKAVKDQKDVAWSCKKGLKPESPNQDSFSILMVEGRYSLLCVYDGHGPQGHDVSDLVRQLLPVMFLTNEHVFVDNKKAFEESFTKCQQEVEAVMDANAKMSGTTVTMALHDVRTDHLWIGHVGDSRAVLGIGSKEKAGQRDPLDLTRAGLGAAKSLDLTVDHKPDLEKEKHRIENSNPPGRVLFDGFYNHRVFALAGMYPGLNMSRAIGDTVGHHEAGLTAMPDVRDVNLKQLREKHPGAVLTLLLCTDGVWEFLESEEAVNLVLHPQFNTIKDATEALVKQSWDRWMADSEGEISDDITAILVQL